MYFFGQHNRRLAVISLIRGILPVLVVSLMAGCGGDEGPAQVTKPSPIQVMSGMFAVTATSEFNGCNRTDVFDGMYQIQINGSDFSMGNDWTGDWNASTLKARGESDRVQSAIRNCTVTDWTTVDLTFTSEDEFLGTIIYRHRVVGGCDGSCQSSWSIAGVRDQGP